MLRISNCPRGNTHISSTTFILVLPVEAGSMPLRHSAQFLRLGNVPSNCLRLREHGEKLPLQTAAVLERVQQARQGKKNQGVIEAEIVARPVRERHGEREGGETPRMIVDR